MYQQTQVDLSPGLNAFAQGMAARQQRQQAQAIGNAFSQGNYQQAADTAFKQGNLDAGIKIQEFAAKASAQEVAAARERAGLFTQIASSALQLPEDQRGQYIANSLSRMNLDPAMAQQLPDYSDGRLRAIGMQSMETAKQLDQALNERKADQTDYSNRTNRMNAQVGVTNAQTAQDRLGLDREKFGEDTRQFNVGHDLSERQFAFERQQAEQAAQQGPEPSASMRKYDEARSLGASHGEALESAFGIAQGAGGQEVDPVQVKSLSTLVDNIDRLLPEGELAKGFTDNFGMTSGSLDAGFRTPFAPIRRAANRDRVNANALIEQITGGLTLEQAAALKGVLSDKDMALLERSASRLSTRSISDDEAVQALTEVRDLLSIRLRQAGGTPPARTPGGRAGNGRPRQIQSAEDYNQLQPGETYIDPNGVERVKG